MIQRNFKTQVITTVINLTMQRNTMNKTLHAYFKEEGIKHQTSTPRTPEPERVVERRNRPLVRGHCLVPQGQRRQTMTTLTRDPKTKFVPFSRKGQIRHIQGRTSSVRQTKSLGTVEQTIWKKIITLKGYEEKKDEDHTVLSQTNTTCLQKMDVKMAFLNGPLKEEVLCLLAGPEGFVDPESPNKVLPSRKAL
ncbi:retrovirus-related pol polyprotein from transposon TNT 1-94 [Tanacetum coccineum]